MCQWPLGGQHFYWGTRLAVCLCTHPHPSVVPQPQEEFIYSSFLVCLCLGFCSQRCRITLLFLTLISPSESFQGFGGFFVCFVFYGAMSLLVYFIFPSDYTWIFFSSWQFPVYVGKWSLLHILQIPSARPHSAPM